MSLLSPIGVKTRVLFWAEYVLLHEDSDKYARLYLAECML